MKKTLLLLLALTATLALRAQISYDITVGESTIMGMAYLISLEDEHLIDSAKVDNNGTAHFRGKAPQPTVACVSSNPRLNGYTCALVLDDKTLKMEHTGDGRMLLRKASDENHRLQDILNRLQAVNDRNILIIQEYSALKRKENVPDSALKALGKQRDRLKREFGDVMRQAMQENRSGVIPLLFLQRSLEDIGADFAEQFLADYPHKDRPSLKATRLKIEALKAKEAGNMMVDVILPDLTGTPRKLSDYVGRGKYILLDFWASWCGPCMGEIPHLKAAYEKFRNKNFDIVGISLDLNRSSWEEAVYRKDLPWNHLSDLRGWSSKAAEAYNIRSIPSTILFDPEGHIIATNLRGPLLEEKLREVLE